MSLEMLGAEEGGYGDIIRAATELTARGVDEYQKQQAAQKAGVTDRANLQAAIAADMAAAVAIAQSMTSRANADKNPKDANLQATADADAAAMQVALSSQADAGAQSPASLSGERVKAANAALADATKKLQSAPTNVYNQNLVKAWGKVLMMSQNSQFRGAAQGPIVPSTGWSTGAIVGVTAGVAAGVVALFLALRKWVFRA